MSITHNSLLVLVVSVAALAGPGKIPTSAQKELRLIQSKSDIENPRIVVNAVPLICRTFYYVSISMITVELLSLSIQRSINVN